MSFPSNLHTHTHYSDGDGTPEEYIQAAIMQGMVSVGISDHIPAPYDVCGIPPEQYPSYIAELHRLKEQYRDQIQVCCGIEWDYYVPMDRRNLDYVIGSVHHLATDDGRFVTIDYRHEDFQEAVQAFGSPQAVIERYYECVVDTALTHRPDIIGHLDLITKLNGDKRYFDPGSAWYNRLTDTVCGAIERSGCIVEVNTGIIGREGRTYPYPAPDLLRKLRRQNIPLTLSSDAHQVSRLSYQFEECIKQLRDLGITTLQMMQGGRFVPFSVV